MADYQAQRGWPTRSCDLLLRAALCEPVMARQAWDQWSREFGQDKASWSEVRLLATVARRFPEPSLQGVRRFVWVQTQMQLVPALAGLRRLAQADVDLLLLKGAARVAADPTVAAERLIRDLDVLVPVAQAERALTLLMEDGWELSEWQRLQRLIDPITSHHAWAVSRAGGEIDLHHFSNFLNREPGQDAGLWARSHSVEWQGLQVRLPSATDGLLLAILHGIRWSKEKAVDWVLDAASYLRLGVQWDVLEREAKDRQVALIVHAGLTYLRDRLGLAVPDSAISALASTEPKDEERLFLYAYIAYQPVVGL